MASTTNPLYGNYHGYYSKRPFVRDSRLSLLPPHFFAGKTVLDIGCNEGWVTCEIGQLWGAQGILGVDIDDTLIRAAWKRRRSLWSQQSLGLRLHDPSVVTPKRVKQYHDDDHDYFPASCEHSYGPLPIPSNRRGVAVFPHNVTFRTMDWMTEQDASDESRYDIVLALSITKWIHLNHGDHGIKTFFQKIHRNLKPGGTLILEPQAWETYSKARRMDERLRDIAKHLHLRPADFHRVLGDIGFGPPMHLGSVGEGGFRRPVDLYVKI